MTRFCSLFSSSSGNALYLEYKNTRLLIDCGVSCKKICEALKGIDVSPSDIDGVLVTHEHSDHISGIRVFSHNYKCGIYSGERTLSSLPCENLSAVESGRVFEIGDIEILPFDIPHDALQPFGYSFKFGNTKLSVATDMGKIDVNVAENIRGSDIVFIESNHDSEMLKTGPYPVYLKKRITGTSGHLSNDQCATLAAALARTGTKQFILGHLSEINNTPEIAKKTVGDGLKNEGFKIGKDILLDVAPKDSTLKIYDIK